MSRSMNRRIIAGAAVSLIALTTGLSAANAATGSSPAPKPTMSMSSSAKASASPKASVAKKKKKKSTVVAPKATPKASAKSSK